MNWKKKIIELPEFIRKNALISLIWEIFTYKKAFRSVLVKTWMARYGDECISLCKPKPPEFNGREKQKRIDLAVRLFEMSLGIRLAEQTLLNAERFKPEAIKPFRIAGLWFALFFALVMVLSPWPLFSTIITLLAVSILYVVFNKEFGLRGVLNKILPETISAVDKKAATEFVSRTVVRPYSADAPADLRDPWRVMLLDANGKALSEQISEEDIVTPYFYNGVKEAAAEVRASQYLSLVLNAGTGFMVMFFILAGLAEKIGQWTGWTGLVEDIQLVTPYSSAVIVMLFALAIIFYLTKPVTSEYLRRIRQLSEISQRSVDSSAATNGLQVNALQFEKARKIQIENAKSDKTQFLHLGESTGLLYERCDTMAPSLAGLPFGLSVLDLAGHLFVFGGASNYTGVGIIRPLLKQWMDRRCGGALVLDGKGSMPADIRHKQYHLISPYHEVVNPVENLSPEDIAETLSELYSDKNDKTLSTSAERLITAAAYAVKAVKRPWTLAEIYQLILSSDERKYLDTQVSELTPKEFSSLKSLQCRSLDFLTMEFDGQPDAPAIVQEAVRWLRPVTENEHLLSWAEAEKGIHFETICRGARFGVSLSVNEFGEGALAVSAFIKKRICKAVQKRGLQWQTNRNQRVVLLVVTDCHSLLGSKEDSVLSLSEKFGLRCVYSAPGVESLSPAIDGNNISVFLQKFRSIVATHGQTQATMDYLAGRFGTVVRPKADQSESVDAVHIRIARKIQEPAGGYYEKAPGWFDTIANAGIRLITLPSAATRYLINPGERQRVLTGLGNITMIEHLTNSQSASADSHRESVVAQKNLKITMANQSKNQGLTVQSIGMRQVIEAEEINELLSAPHSALAMVTRGGVMRRDLITMFPLYES